MKRTRYYTPLNSTKQVAIEMINVVMEDEEDMFAIATSLIDELIEDGTYMPDRIKTFRMNTNKTADVKTYDGVKHTYKYIGGRLYNSNNVEDEIIETDVEELEEDMNDNMDQALLRACKAFKKSPDAYGVIYGYTQKDKQTFLNPVLVKDSQEEIDEFEKSFRRPKQAQKITLYVLYADNVEKAKRALKQKGLLESKEPDPFTNNIITRK